MKKNNLQKYKEDVLKYGIIKEEGKRIRQVGKCIEFLCGSEELNDKRLKIKKYYEEKEGGNVPQKWIDERFKEYINHLYLHYPSSLIPKMVNEIKKYKETAFPEFLEIVKDDLNSLERHCVRCLKMFKEFDEEGEREGIPPGMRGL